MRKKLFLSSMAIVLLTLLLSLLSVELVIKRQFTDYVSRSVDKAVRELPDRLANIYNSYGTWDEFSLYQLGRSLPSGITVLLKDLDGELIATITKPSAKTSSTDETGGDLAADTGIDVRMHNGLGMSMGMDQGMRFHMGWRDNVTESWYSKEVEVQLNDTVIAVATIYYPAQTILMDPADIAFVNEVFRYLLVAWGLALILGIGLSWWMSRRLTSPLHRLTQAAHRIGEGHFDERVPVTTNDEIGQLASAFNSMIDNLAHQEKLRKQFTADIAHELRTPLTSIRSYIEAFQDGVLPASPENLSSISEEIERLAHLANDLKDLNIAEIGKLELHPSKVDLALLLDKVIHNLYSLFQEKDLSLNWNKPKESMILEGDEALLTRLFFNLIHNAYKYTPEGGRVTITCIKLNERDKRKSRLEVKISDTGIGIPEEELENIFERFYRTDKSRTRETGGAGIGLALANQIAKLHHGEIKVSSVLNQGTTFTVYLPVSQEG